MMTFLRQLTIILSALTFLLTTAYATLAVTATPSATASPSAIPSLPAGQGTPASKKAQDLLDRVATKVAQLSNTMRRAYHGTIKTIGKNTLVITTPEGDKTIITNDATNFYKIRAGSRTDSDFKSLKIGDDMAAVGTIDPQTSDMTAVQIIVKIHRFNLVGIIAFVDKNDIITLTDPQAQASKADLDSAITLKKADSNGKISLAKISDFQANLPIFIIGHSPDAKTGVYSILKTLVLVK